MLENKKDQKETSDDTIIESILSKFEITALNPMQERASKAIRAKSEVV